MTEDKGIRIQNIFHMLSYAYKVLKQTNYRDIASEEFEHIEDLFAAILAKGISQQLKQGLYRQYVPQEDSLPVLRGKLDVQKTIRNQIQHRRTLACQYDEFSENNIFNQILKTTLNILVRESVVSIKNKNALRQILFIFGQITPIDPFSVHWNMLNFQKNNQTYKMLMNVCRFVLDGMLMTTVKGHYRMREFSDESMSRLYEKFILEYYRYHHPELRASSTQVTWDLAPDTDERALSFLPEMRTDVTLSHDEKTLIIDAKYYTRTMQQHFDHYSFHSHNMYQIYSYVKNKDTNNASKVAGLLLYAKTGETITPDNDYVIGGNPISVKTLDLNMPFSGIADQLDAISNYVLK